MASPSESADLKNLEGEIIPLDDEIKRLRQEASLQGIKPEEIESEMKQEAKAIAANIAQQLLELKPGSGTTAEKAIVCVSPLAQGIIMKHFGVKPAGAMKRVFTDDRKKCIDEVRVICTNKEGVEYQESMFFDITKSYARFVRMTRRVADNAWERGLFACGGCGESNTEGRMSKCEGCSGSVYCDEFCQKAHWSLHKRICRNPENEHKARRKEHLKLPQFVYEMPAGCAAVMDIVVLLLNEKIKPIPPKLCKRNAIGIPTDSDKAQRAKKMVEFEQQVKNKHFSEYTVDELLEYYVLFVQKVRRRQITPDDLRQMLIKERETSIHRLERAGVLPAQKASS